MGQRPVQRTGELGEQHLAGLEIGELADVVCRHRPALDDPTLDDQGGIGAGEVTQALGRLDRVAGDERDRCRADQEFVQTRNARLRGGNPGQGVLHHGVLGALAQRTA